jgi:lipopolysaccharide transport system permease protein
MAASTPLVVYSGDYRPSLWAQVRQVVARRELLLALVERDLRVRYKQTILGVLWAVIPPLMLMVVFNIFFGRLAKMPSEGFPYPVFVYAGLLPWTYFSAVISASTTSITASHTIIAKVAFPREILPWVPIVGSGVDFLVSAVIFAGLLAFYGVGVAWTAIFVIPLLLLQIVFMASMSLLFAAFNVYFRDVRYLVPYALQLWLFTSPVIYSARTVPEWLRPFYLVLNPMATIIDGYRQVVLRQSLPDFGLIGVLAAITVGLLVIAYVIFKRAERHFVDVI